MKYEDINLNDGKFIEVVVGYAIDGNKVLLGERKSSQTNLGIGKYVGIGGKLDEGETYDQALEREFKEETNIELKAYIFAGVVEWLYPSGIRPNMRSIAYIVNEWDGNPEETESIKPEWFDINEIPIEKMFHDNRYSVPRFLKGEKLYAVFTYNDDGKEVVNMDIKTLK